MAVDFKLYTGHRDRERYEYKRLTWPGLVEVGEYGNVTGGHLDRASSSPVKESGSIEFYGKEHPSTRDAVRVYHVFESNGVEVRDVVLTHVVSLSEMDVDITDHGIMYEGMADISSVLSVAQSKIVGRPFVLAEGSDAIAAAVGLLRSIGIKVLDPHVSFFIAAQMYFEPGNSYLDIANSLLTAAGMSEARVTPMGVAYFVRDVSNGGSTPVYTFANNSDTVIDPKITEARKLASSPNTVHVSYTSGSVCVFATARNVRGSANSIQELGGREVGHYESLSRVTSSTDEEVIRSEVLSHAIRLVGDFATECVTVKFGHAYVPVKVDDSVALTLSAKGDDVEWVFVIDSMSIDFSLSMPCVTSGSRYAAYDIDIETEVGSAWTQLQAARSSKASGE